MSVQDQQVRILDTPCPPAQPLQRHLLPQRMAPKYAEGGRPCDDPTFHVMGDHDDDDEEEEEEEEWGGAAAIEEEEDEEEEEEEEEAGRV